MKTKIFFLAILFAGATSQGFAGWVFVQDSEGERQTWHIQDNQIKFAAPDHVMIFDVNRNMLCFANSREKTYWQGTPDEFSTQARKDMKNLDKIVDQQLAGMPASQRNPFKQSIHEQMRRQTADSPVRVTVRDSGASATVAGYKVRKYEIRVNNEIRQEQWIAGDIQVSQTLDVARFGKMMRTFQGRLGGEDAALSSPEVISLLKKGWPLRKVDYDDEGYREVEDVTKVEKKKIPGSAFAPPAGYRRISLADIFGK